MITITSVEAQNRFGQLLDTVQREPVTITRHGRPAAFIISPQDMKDLQEARRQRSSASEVFDAFFARTDEKLTPAARKHTDEEVVSMVLESR